jgi:hypothetical protein
LSEVDPRKVREANLLLTLSTGLALVVLIGAAWAAGPLDKRWWPVAVGPAVVVIYLLVNRFLLKRPAKPPMVQPDSPVTLLFAGILPLILLACAGAALVWRGHDFTLAVIVGGVLFGLTVESALAAPKG